MKIYPAGALVFLLAGGVTNFPGVVYAQQETRPVDAPISSATILRQAREISDAQLASLKNQNRNPLDWIGGTMWAGVADFSHVSQRSAEDEAIIAMGDKAGWKPLSHPKTPFHADDDCIGQAFLAAYAQHRDSRYLEPMRTDMDALVVHLNEPQPDPTKLTWWWCDALFMAPPVLTRMSNVTGDSKYIDAMDKEWWRVANALYDPQEHLFYRDKRFLPMTTKNGKKVFWSRGNGWVIGGLTRVLTWMPLDYPIRPKYEQMFQAMSAKLLSLQGTDGAWRTSLLDADEFPAPETSGTAFYCYGMAWGVNNGLLPRATYAPAALKAWSALMANKRPDGLPGWVQLVGDRPGKAEAQGTQLYATGGMLLAATELMKMLDTGPTMK